MGSSLPPADDLIIMPMHLRCWPQTLHLADRSGEIPTIVFAPFGTTFANRMQKLRTQQKTLTVSTGQVVRNVKSNTGGGCRTAVEIAVDDLKDVRDFQGFHQVVLCGKFDRELASFAELSGLHAHKMWATWLKLPSTNGPQGPRYDSLGRSEVAAHAAHRAQPQV